MIDKLMGDLYWDGLEEEFDRICLTSPYVFISYQDNIAVPSSIYNTFLEDVSFDQFLIDFIYHRANVFPSESRPSGYLTATFETRVFTNRILDNLQTIQNKMITIITSRQFQIDYESGHFFSNDQFVKNLFKIKNLEELWQIITGK